PSAGQILAGLLGRIRQAAARQRSPPATAGGCAERGSPESRDPSTPACALKRAVSWFGGGLFQGGSRTAQRFGDKTATVGRGPCKRVHPHHWDVPTALHYWVRPDTYQIQPEGRLFQTASGNGVLLTSANTRSRAADSFPVARPMLRCSPWLPAEANLLAS